MERPIKGYSAHQLLNIIVGKRVCNGNICKQVPCAVRTHAAYVVDTEAIGSSDIMAFGDDNGSWGGQTKPCRKYSVEVSEKVGISTSSVYKPDDDYSQKMYTHCIGTTFSIVTPLQLERSSQQSSTGRETSCL